MVFQWSLSFLLSEVPSPPETASTSMPATATPVETEVSELSGSLQSGTPQKAMDGPKTEMLCDDGYVGVDVTRLKMSHQSNPFPEKMETK